MHNDPVNHPTHYCSHPSGVECIQITEHMNFNLGNALKYVWRADLKNDGLEDLRKARFYLDREIALRLAEPHRGDPPATQWPTAPPHELQPIHQDGKPARVET